jgi:hypothetical protein
MRRGIAVGALATVGAAGAFWDERSRAGYDDPLFMNGEETDAEGRALARARRHEPACCRRETALTRSRR